jgi:cytochrome c-type biogenesis protein CcmH/NrfF
MQRLRVMMLLLILMAVVAALHTQDRSTVAAEVLMGFLFRFWRQLRLPVCSRERGIRGCMLAMTTRLP